MWIIMQKFEAIQYIMKKEVFLNQNYYQCLKHYERYEYIYWHLYNLVLVSAIIDFRVPV